VATDATEAARGMTQRCGDPTDNHRAVPPAAHVASEGSHRAMEVLDGVGRAERSVEGAADSETLQREHLVEPFAQRGSGSGMILIERASKCLELTPSQRGIVRLVGLREHSADVGVHRLGEMIEDVALLVDLAALDDGEISEEVEHGLVDPLPPSMTNSRGRSVGSPRSIKSASRALATAAFSVEPS
jgi:hypothetical protein